MPLGIRRTRTEGFSLEEETTWILAFGYGSYATHRLYFVAVYVACNAMFGGVSSLEPQNYLEQVTLTFMMLVGSLVWAWVIGSMCSLLAAFKEKSADRDRNESQVRAREPS